MRTMQFVIALVVALGFHGVSGASEPTHGLDKTRGNEHGTRDDEAAILRAVEQFAQRSIRGDVEGLMALWDTRAAKEVSFTQVENELPVVGLHNFRAYYASHLQHIITLDGDVSDVHIQRMGNLAIVSCRFTWVSQYVATGHVSVDSTRATVVLRKHGQRWLYVHMHESITYS